MSLFDFPRIHFKGTISFSPGTANNADYAANLTLPQDWGPFAGKALSLIDSQKVEPQTYGLSDKAFVKWVQKEQPFDQGSSPTKQIPAEWNYYGTMEMDVSAQVISVQTDRDHIYSQPDEDVPLTNMLGAAVTFAGGHFTDVNSEGSPPATQFFIDQLTVKQSDQPFIQGQTSKGTGLWLNFYRNVNLAADGGAGAYVYHIIQKSQPDTMIQVPGFPKKKVAGIIFRYYLYRPLIGGTPEEIEALYQQKKTNPAELEIIGTFTPLYQNETITTMPTGRLLIADTPTIKTPPGSKNNGGKSGLIALAPAVLQQNGDIISADFVGSFPDYYQKISNPKFDFGPVVLQVSDGTDSETIGAVAYADTKDGDQKGWLYDFDISKNQKVQKILQSPDATFQLVHSDLGPVLAETDYYFVTNQLAVYAEQFSAGTQFLNQGSTEPITLSVYRRGNLLSAKSCPAISLWQYRSVPLQAPGNVKLLTTNFKPNKPLTVDTSQPGDFLFTFTINDDANPAPHGYPPPNYAVFANPPYITNAPSINLRILPNEEDFSQYFVDPNAEEPVGNDLLTFDIVYEKALRTYFLLYPAMNNIFALDSAKKIARNAAAILQVTDRSMWLSSGYMPRTRDMSASRAKLLRAWCRKVLQS